jgi:hypothetical protein
MKKRSIAILVGTVLLAGCGRESFTETIRPGPAADAVPGPCKEWMLRWDTSRENRPAGCESYGNWPSPHNDLPH